MAVLLPLDIRCSIVRALQPSLALNQLQHAFAVVQESAQLAFSLLTLSLHSQHLDVRLVAAASLGLTTLSLANSLLTWACGNKAASAKASVRRSIERVPEAISHATTQIRRSVEGRKSMEFENLTNRAVMLRSETRTEAQRGEASVHRSPF